MTAFDKAWGVLKGNQIEDDNETSMELRGEPLPEGEQLCDGLETADTGDNNCQGDGLLGEDGGYECSSCGNLHCPECHHHYSLEDEQIDFEHRINFKDSGLEFSLGTDVDSALDHAGLGDASNICGHCIENRVPGAIEEYIEYVHGEVAAEEEQKEDERERDEEFNQRVDQAPFFGDNRGETLFSDTSPHLHSKFNPDWQDKMKSKDSFEMAWGVVKASPCCDRPRLIERQDGSTRCRTCQQSKVSKEAPTEECKGCGLAHGSPNSEYCSEICERQNMKKSDDMLRDALARKLPPRKEFSEKEIEAMMGRRVLPPRKDPEDDPLVHRARKNLMEERKNRRQ
tara:strand:- start:10087 stop:11109 length:1023 start_codon:yes stop_codon:yes gene_type:complete